MASTTSTVYKALSKSVTFTHTTTKALLEEPLLTGPLLYVLTRGPANLRARLLEPFQSNLLSTDAPQRIAKLITVLKLLFVIGLGKRANSFLNTVALNNWHVPWRKPGRPFIWDGKTETVVLTGGASGFGFEMVKLFAGKARVVVLDVQELPKELTQLPEVYFYQCDLTNSEKIVSVSSQIKTRFGNPSVLINNAGIGAGKSIIDTSDAFLEKIMRVNLMCHFTLIREFVPGMMEQKKGHVVSVCSMASFGSASGLVDYCVTKVGALALMEGLRNELLQRHAHEGGRTIQTTTVHPSWHDTGILAGVGTKSRLLQFGIVPDPAINVSKAIAEQVFAGRSGKIFVPKDQERMSKARNMSLWTYDIMLKNVRLPWSMNVIRHGSEKSGESLL